MVDPLLAAPARLGAGEERDAQPDSTARSRWRRPRLGYAGRPPALLMRPRPRSCRSMAPRPRRPANRLVWPTRLRLGGACPVMPLNSEAMVMVDGTEMVRARAKTATLACR